VDRPAEVASDGIGSCRLPIVGVALAASIFLKELPLRDMVFVDEDAGKQVPNRLNRDATGGARAAGFGDVRQRCEHEP
jgi:hypothetical protein